MPYRWTRRQRVVVAVSFFLLALIVRNALAGMDPIWFKLSLRGAQGLGLYLIGDYAGAARAYRAHYRGTPFGKGDSGDAARDALLRGDASVARYL